jgi:hypothetical protein
MAAYLEFPKAHLLRRDKNVPFGSMEPTMGDIKDELIEKAATGSDLRDVAGAWLVCALIAVLALAVSGDLHDPGASAPIATAFDATSR